MIEEPLRKSREQPMRCWVHRAFILSVAVLSLVHCTPAADLSLETEAQSSSATQLQTGSISKLPASSSPGNDALVRQAQAIYRASEDLVLGNPAGNITIVAFFDYNCGYCQRAVPEVHKLVNADNNVRFVIKEFPILGPDSMFAAKAALASAKQGKYAEFHAALTTKKGIKNKSRVLAAAQKIGLDVAKLQTDMEDTSVTQVIARNHALARSLSIDGTPTFILDETIQPSFMPYKILAQHVAFIRENGGCRLC
jgi:protein-disulfide isomerase